MVRYNPRAEKNFKRFGRTREVKQSFLIVCEGVNTEPEYFKAFRLTSASVKAIGEEIGTTRLVEEAIIVKELETRKHHVYDQYWVVFDKDQSSDETFSKAIKLAEKNGFKVELIVIRLLNIGSYYISTCIKEKFIANDMKKCFQRLLALLIAKKRDL